mgnify:CR=1 FL=1
MNAIGGKRVQMLWKVVCGREWLFLQAEDGMRGVLGSRGLREVCKLQGVVPCVLVACVGVRVCVFGRVLWVVDKGQGVVP